MNYRYRISNSKPLLNLAVITDKNNQDASLELYNVIAIVRCFFSYPIHIHQTSYGTGVISKKLSHKMKLFLDKEKFKGTT